MRRAIELNLIRDGNDHEPFWSLSNFFMRFPIFIVFKICDEKKLSFWAYLYTLKYALISSFFWNDKESQAPI